MLGKGGALFAEAIAIAHAALTFDPERAKPCGGTPLASAFDWLSVRNWRITAVGSQAGGAVQVMRRGLSFRPSSRV